MLPDVGAGPKPQRGGDLSGEQQKHLERLLQGWRWMETAGGIAPGFTQLGHPLHQPSSSSPWGWERGRSVLVF